MFYKFLTNEYTRNENKNLEIIIKIDEEFQSS